LQLIEFISAGISAKKKVYINFGRKMNGQQDKKQLELVDQLFSIFRHCSNNNLELHCSFDNMRQYIMMKDLDNKLETINLTFIEESQIEMLMKLLATPRPDGKQRVMQLDYFEEEQLDLAAKLVAAIKTVK
jgi:hypothetical protein